MKRWRVCVDGNFFHKMDGNNGETVYVVFLPDSMKEKLPETAGDTVLRSPTAEYAAPPLCLSEEAADPSAIDWSVRDVLIGTVRNQQQYDICRKNRFYYIPAERISASQLPVHYVTMLKARRTFGESGGMFLYGEVSSTTLVRRAEIREVPVRRAGDEKKLYYRFEICRWLPLPSPIRSDEPTFVSGFTNLFLLKHAAQFPELMLRSEEEYRLCAGLRHLLEGDGGIGGFITGSYAILLRQEKIILCRGREPLCEFPAAEYRACPFALFRILSEIMDV